MKMSRYFLPTLKEVPSEAQLVSHRLMLRAGMIAQECAGIYHWLPLGLRVLQKVEAIVRQGLNDAGFHELLMPTLQPAELWEESGRYEAYGKEMLRITDRHERRLLYGPTAEEAVTDIVRRFIHSYKELPQVLYQFQWKFRDEIRPRFGVMRGREFYMKDAYSFDLDRESAEKTYRRVMQAYLSIFQNLGLKAIPVRADTGPIGGDLSHEFQILAETGESDIYYDGAFDEFQFSGEEDNLDQVMKLYAMADDMHDATLCPVPTDRLKHKKGIEVGHIFYFGTKYSLPMKTTVTNEQGKPVLLESGSYGIGVSRVVAALIETNHDEFGIMWPEQVAPFKIGLINLKVGDALTDTTCTEIYKKFQSAGVEILYDDRSDSVGVKFSTMDLIGVPYQVIVGPRGLKEGQVEIKTRRTGEKILCSVEELYGRFLTHA
jgi:prolyl-tRNA synthetase